MSQPKQPSKSSKAQSTQPKQTVSKRTYVFFLFNSSQTRIFIPIRLVFIVAGKQETLMKFVPNVQISRNPIISSVYRHRESP